MKMGDGAGAERAFRGQVRSARWRPPRVRHRRTGRPPRIPRRPRGRHQHLQGESSTQTEERRRPHWPGQWRCIARAQVDEAIACYQKAVALDPKYAGARKQPPRAGGAMWRQLGTSCPLSRTAATSRPPTTSVSDWPSGARSKSSTAPRPACTPPPSPPTRNWPTTCKQATATTPPAPAALAPAGQGEWIPPRSTTRKGFGCAHRLLDLAAGRPGPARQATGERSACRPRRGAAEFAALAAGQRPGRHPRPGGTGETAGGGAESVHPTLGRRGGTAEEAEEKPK